MGARNENEDILNEKKLSVQGRFYLDRVVNCHWGDQLIVVSKSLRLAIGQGLCSREILRFTVVVCLLSCIQAHPVFACRYNVRETGFVDLGIEPFLIHPPVIRKGSLAEGQAGSFFALQLNRGRSVIDRMHVKGISRDQAHREKNRDGDIMSPPEEDFDRISQVGFLGIIIVQGGLRHSYCTNVLIRAAAAAVGTSWLMKTFQSAMAVRGT